MMNKIICSLAVLCCCSFMAVAQGKIATVDVEAIYNIMPEKAQAQATLKVTSDQYKKEYATVQEEFDKKYAVYQALAADATTPATIKERRMREIQENDRKIQEFLREAKSDMEKREKDLTESIKAKIKNAVEEVGKDGGYTYILDISSGTVVYSGIDAVDVTPQVKAKLGLQ